MTKLIFSNIKKIAHFKVVNLRNRVENLKMIMTVIDFLRIAKKDFTYWQLSQKLGIPIETLCSYVRGHCLPRIGKAEIMRKILSPIVFFKLKEELRKNLKFYDEKYLNNTKIIGNRLILYLASRDAQNRFLEKKVTKVLTAAVDGLPLATMVAQTLGRELVIAKREKEVGVKEFIEETFPLGDKTLVMLFIPKGSIKKNDKVLIVDDVIRKGEIQKALFNLVRKCEAEVTGIYTLITIGNEFEKNFPPECNLETVLKIEKI